MMYSKGDTIKLYGEVTGLVLNDGMKGKEFVTHYRGQQIVQLFKNHGSLYRFIVYGGQYMQDHVWYHILIGDVKGWYAVSTKGD